MKKACLVLALVLVFGLWSGCTPEAKTGTSSGKPVEITVITSYGVSDGNRPNYVAAVEAYQNATGNIIKDASGISNEEWKARIMADFEAGAEPDVLFYFSGADSNKLVMAKKVVPIDEIRREYPNYASNMKDSMLAKSPVDGKNYAVPVNGYWEGLFVNKKVLADCGVDVPDANTTWDEFLESCRVIASKGYTPLACSLAQVPHYWFEYCVFNNGSIESHPQIPKTADDPMAKIWAAGLNDIKNLYELGFFPDNTFVAEDSETFQLLADDKAAFAIDGSWKTNWFSENLSGRLGDFTITYVPGKGERRTTDIIGGISMGYFITRKAWDNPEKRAACVDFVNAMTTDAVVSTFGIATLTALKNGETPPSNASSLVKDALVMINGNTGITNATADDIDRLQRESLFSNVHNVAAGTITAEEAIADALNIAG